MFLFNVLLIFVSDVRWMCSCSMYDGCLCCLYDGHYVQRRLIRFMFVVVKYVRRSTGCLYARTPLNDVCMIVTPLDVCVFVTLHWIWLIE